MRVAVRQEEVHLGGVGGGGGGVLGPSGNLPTNPTTHTQQSHFEHPCHHQKSPVLLEVGAEFDEEPLDGAAGEHPAKHRAKIGRKCTIRKRRKFEMTRPAAMTVGLVPQRINALRVKGGSKKYRGAQAPYWQLL